MNKEHRCLILMLFQLQNGHRKLSEFVNINKFPDCYISELVLDSNGEPSLYSGLTWFLYDENGCKFLNYTKTWSTPFPILDYISFEDKV